MKTVAIITARGGSKRIPKKNIKPFCGRPIITYSICAALQSGVFDTVMVSTEDAEIAAIAKAAGASVPFLRSAKTADDFATTADVLKEVLEAYAAKGENYTHACCIYPTAPFVTPEKLQRGMELLQKAEADTVLPVVAFSFPPQRGLHITAGRVMPVDPQAMQMRSQDLVPVYHDCGQFYCLDTVRFLQTGKIIGTYTLPLVMEETEVQDIDNLTDWKLAEMKFKIMQEGLNNEV